MAENERLDVDELVRRAEERHAEREAPEPVEMDDEVTDAEFEEAPAEGPNLSYGYTVGVQEGGNLFFQLHGDEKGAVQLMGLNALARKQISAMVDGNLGAGDFMIMGALQEVFNKLLQMEQRLPELPEPLPLNNSLKLD